MDKIAIKQQLQLEMKIESLKKKQLLILKDMNSIVKSNIENCIKQKEILVYDKLYGDLLDEIINYFKETPVSAQLFIQKSGRYYRRIHTAQYLAELNDSVKKLYEDDTKLYYQLCLSWNDNLLINLDKVYFKIQDLEQKL